MPSIQSSQPVQTEAEFPFKQKVDIFSFHKQGLPAASAIVYRKKKIAYVPIPKNACTSLKIFFYELKNNVELKEHFTKIHGRFDYWAIDFDRFAEDRKFFKFIVIRDPIERFVSAYNNRVKMYRELSKGWFTTNYPNPEPFLKAFEERSLSFDPAIGEFARRIEDYVELNHTIRHHFIPQHNFFHGRPEIFNKVYNIRQMSELASDIANRIGQPASFQNVQETKDLPNPARLSDLSAAELSHIQAYYQQDYRILSPYLQRS
jgi:hypothetical protein